jgi:hypothetical protein
LRGPDLPIGMIKHFWISLAIVLTLAGLFVIWFLGAFNDQGFAPEQPIAYSHKQHAGDLHIPCLYCHFNAERGKHAGVPPMSVCLGCHGQGQGQVLANRPEIQKLAAIAEKGSYTDADGVIHEGGMVHWARVHKLPDHVYFSHQWHVKAGVACQTCHGPVETMAVVRQYAPLTMGWCLDCHRKSNYVGGPSYRKDDPASFAVGSANYDVVRARQLTDPEVEFAPRRIAPDSAPPAQADAAAGASAAHAPHRSAEAAPDAGDAIQRLLKARPELADRPRWRLADLPETHREAYRDLLDKDANGQPILDLSKTFMNAPTQCSTCHQ